MAVKFVTQKGSSSLTTDPFYIALVQHERTMSKKEAYDYLAGKIGYSATAISASFLALKKYIRENAERGNITCVDEVTIAGTDLGRDTENADDARFRSEFCYTVRSKGGEHGGIGKS